MPNLTEHTSETVNLEIWAGSWYKHAERIKAESEPDHASLQPVAHACPDTLSKPEFLILSTVTDGHNTYALAVSGSDRPIAVSIHAVENTDFTNLSQDTLEVTVKFPADMDRAVKFEVIGHPVAIAHPLDTEVPI